MEDKLKKIDYLLTQRVDLTKDNYQIIDFILEKNMIEIMRTILDRGFDPSYNNNYAIKKVMINNNESMTSLLLQHPSVKIDDPDKDILISVIGNYNIEMLKYLITNIKYTFMDEDIWILITACQCPNKEIPYLLWTIMSNHINKVSDVYTKEIMENLLSTNNIETLTCMINNYPMKFSFEYDNNNLAFNLSNNNMNQLLYFLIVNVGIDIEFRNNYLIRNSTKMNNIEITKLLINRGVNASVNNNESLHNAIKNLNLEMIKLLIEVGNVRPDNDSLKIAIKLGSYEIVDYLLNFEDINIMENNYEILSIALTNNQEDLAKYIVKRKNLNWMFFESNKCKKPVINTLDNDYNILISMLYNSINTNKTKRRDENEDYARKRIRI